MKANLRFAVFMLWLLAPHVGTAADTPEDLIQIMEEAVARARAGDFNESVRITNAAATNPMAPQAAMDQATKIQEVYRSLERLGDVDGIERVSLRFVGESFFRLRVVDKREEGVVLWTFIGYRFKGRWYCEGLHISGNSDLMELMRKELDPADAAPDASPASLQFQVDPDAR